MLHLTAKCLVHLSLFYLLKRTQTFSACWSHLEALIDVHVTEIILCFCLIKFGHPGEKSSSEKNNTVLCDQYFNNLSLAIIEVTTSVVIQALPHSISSKKNFYYCSLSLVFQQPEFSCRGHYKCSNSYRPMYFKTLLKYKNIYLNATF